MLTILEILKRLGQEDASPLGACLRLSDDDRIKITLHEISAFVNFRGQDPGFGEKIIIVWKLLLHFD